MKIHLKNLIAFTLTIVFLFISATNETFAATKQSKDITYDIQENETTNITYNITLTNENANTYIAKYRLSTGLSSVENIFAKLESGSNLTYNVSKENENSTIEIYFPQSNTWQKEVKWSLSFTSSDVVEDEGMTKEIVLPGFVGDFDLSITLIIPKSFGSINYFSAEPNETSELTQKTVYKYTGDKIRKTGIYISVGDYQVYDFTYKYELKNEEETRLRATIALPPDYKNQKVYYESFTPIPDNGYKDKDGNYIAEYIVEPGESYEVQINGKAKLLNTLTNTFTSPKQDLEKYTQQDLYWEADNSEIINLSNEITKNLTTDKEKAKAIYDYVVSNLSYNLDALNDAERTRIGALGILSKKDNAICQEFTDLFIALTRAQGIPARMLAGYTTAKIGYDLPTNTQHAWAEFYTEEEGWITVDPTWENTSTGFNFFGNVSLNHFVLAIRGVDSENPPLVLSFVPTDDVSDNLQINPSTVDVEDSGEIDFKISAPQAIQTAVKSNAELKIKNNTKSIISGVKLITESSRLSIELPEFDEEKTIFPGQEEIFNASIYPNSLFESFTENLIVNLETVKGEDEEVKFAEELTLSVEMNDGITYGLMIVAFILSIIIAFVARAIIRKIRNRKK